MSTHTGDNPSSATQTAVLQEDVSFSSSGERYDGWLFRPHTGSRVPGVVLAHGIGGIKSAALPAFARRFAASGFAALVFDHRHLGTSDGTPRGLIDVRRQQTDLGAAIAFLRGVDAVDPARIVLWGTSFGAAHVLSAAAGDTRLAAAVLQNPFVDGRAAAVATLQTAGPARSAALAGLAVRDRLRALRALEPVRVPLVGPPQTLAMMTTEDAEPGYASILPDDPVGWEPSVPARIMLQMRHYRPGRKAGRVCCPLLVSVCDHDRLAPPGPAVKVADEAPHGTLHRYPIGHFDLFVDPWLDRVATDQIAFLRRTVFENHGQ